MTDNATNDETSLERENRSLRQRVDELEHTLSDVPSESSTTFLKAGVQRWKVAAFGLIMVISLIPSYLVMQERWFRYLVTSRSIYVFWENSPLLKSLAYPRYFVLIFVSTLLLAPAVFLWRGKMPLVVFSNLNLGSSESPITDVNSKQHKVGKYLLITAIVGFDLSAIWMFLTRRIPGWDLLLPLILFLIGLVLLEPAKTSLRDLFQAHGRFLLDASLFVIALCAALYAAFGETEPNLIFYVLLVLAGWNFFRHRKDTPLLFWVSITSLVALTWKINDWHYVVIGDEYSFFTEIRGILDNRTAWELINKTFDGCFVYGTHPYFSSYIQDFFMKLFGNHNFGWRFSNPVIVACSLPLYYYFFKKFVPRRIAVIIIIMLGFSHYLLSFSKIGYNNLQAFFILGAVLAAFTWALKSMKTLAFCVTGLTMGVCFYLYPAALYVIPLPVIGLLLFMPPTNREALKRWAWMLLSAAFLFYPLMVQPNYWEAKIPGTFLYTDAGNSFGMFVDNFLRNVLYSTFSFLYIPDQSHFVSIGYLDLLSSVFVVIGFVVLTKTILQRNRSALFLALSFLMMFLVVGATHGRNLPTTTRMFLLLPWFALFAAFGLEWSIETARSMFRINYGTISNLVVFSIVALNLYQAYVLDVRNMARYHTLAPLFVKIEREIDANHQVPPKSYAFVADPGWNTDGMVIIQGAYLVPDSPRQLINLPVDGAQLPLSAQELVSQRDVAVIVKTDLSENIVTQVDAQLQSWGKSMCEIRNEEGTLQFQLWHSGDLGWVCP